MLLPVALVALLVLLLSPAAFGYSVGAFSSVQRPGGPVMDNFSELDGAIFAIVDTGTVDNVALGSEARASAEVDLDSRSLKVFVRADGPSINPSARAFANVEITIQPTSLLPEGEIVAVPFSMTVTGVALLDDPGFCLSAIAWMRYGSVVAQPSLDSGCSLLGALPITTMSNVANVVVGQATEVIYELGAALNLGSSTETGVGGVIDASQTAVVSFDFPEGIVATSEPPEFLPESSALATQLAVMLALAGLHALRSVRHRRGSEQRSLLSALL